jgi:hypothetical protein
VLVLDYGIVRLLVQWALRYVYQICFNIVLNVDLNVDFDVDRAGHGPQLTDAAAAGAALISLLASLKRWGAALRLCTGLMLYDCRAQLGLVHAAEHPQPALPLLVYLLALLPLGALFLACLAVQAAYNFCLGLAVDDHINDANAHINNANAHINNANAHINNANAHINNANAHINAANANANANAMPMPIMHMVYVYMWLAAMAAAMLPDVQAFAWACLLMQLLLA